MGGGGGSQTQSTQSAAYPPEFRPLAKSAVQQIQALQQSLPLTMFTDYQPAGTAGLAPWQKFAMDEMVPGTMRPTAGLQGESQTPGAVGAAAMGATAAGNATGAENAALQSLGNRLGQNPGRLPSSTPYQWGMGMQMPGNYNISSVFPGMSEATMQSMRGLSGGQVPVLGGPGVASVNPSQPGTFPDPYQNIRPPVNQEQQILRLQLSDAEGKLFDGYIAQGKDPRGAFNLVMDKRVKELSRLTPLPPAPNPSGGDTSNIP